MEKKNYVEYMLTMEKWNGHEEGEHFWDEAEALEAFNWCKEHGSCANFCKAELVGTFEDEDGNLCQAVIDTWTDEDDEEE